MIWVKMQFTRDFEADVFTGQMPFLSRSRQPQSSDGKSKSKPIGMVVNVSAQAAAQTVVWI